MFHGITEGYYATSYNGGYQPLVPMGDNQIKHYLMTDRPVYRPGQDVHMKVWIGRAAYRVSSTGKDDKSEFAGKEYKFIVKDARGTDVFTQTVTADKFGGIEAVFVLAKDAMLGHYSVVVRDENNKKTGIQYIHIGGFRVEEYKKPEFEVKVEAPEKPIALGEKIPLKVKATYYFGAPVTEGTVSLKVTRRRQGATWCPSGPWDWFYGAGYWWHFQDYEWLSKLAVPLGMGARGSRGRDSAGGRAVRGRHVRGDR